MEVLGHQKQHRLVGLPRYPGITNLSVWVAVVTTQASVTTYDTAPQALKTQLHHVSLTTIQQFITPRVQTVGVL